MFLENERVAAEIRMGQMLPPLAFFNLLTREKSFEWMKPFSALIAEIDEFLDANKLVSDTDFQKFRLKIETMIGDSESKLGKRYNQYLLQDSTFVMAHAELRLQLTSA
jgi:ElaB/YqjD/DUF883 family membrane-anchored ribosome-binding protein